MCAVDYSYRAWKELTQQKDQVWWWWKDISEPFGHLGNVLADFQSCTLLHVCSWHHIHPRPESEDLHPEQKSWSLLWLKYSNVNVCVTHPLHITEGTYIRHSNQRLHMWWGGCIFCKLFAVSGTEYSIDVGGFYWELNIPAWLSSSLV